METSSSDVGNIEANSMEVHSSVSAAVKPRGASEATEHTRAGGPARARRSTEGEFPIHHFPKSPQVGAHTHTHTGCSRNLQYSGGPAIFK